MAYVEFKTENAEYVLLAGYHFDVNRSNHKLSGIDALVVELPYLSNRVIDPEILNPDLSVHVVNCMRTGTPIFNADSDRPITLEEDFIKLIARDFPVILGIRPFLNALSAEEFTLRYKSRVANFLYLTQSVIVEGRNAVAARKIEEWIAPAMYQRLGRKPKIGLVYGTSHLGLEPDLKSKRRRDFTLWNMRNFNFWKYAGLGKIENLNKIHEANWDGEWKITEHQTELFK